MEGQKGRHKVIRSPVVSLMISVCAILVIGLLIGVGVRSRIALARSQKAEVAEFSIEALYNEIQIDSLGIGYKDDGIWKSDAEIAVLINVKNYVIDATSINMEACRAGIHYEAYNDLAADEQEWLRWMTPSSGQFVISADTKMKLTGRTPAVAGVAGTGDNSNSWWSLAERDTVVPEMLTLIELPASRAEVLWGEGTFITLSQIGQASNLQE